MKLKIWVCMTLLLSWVFPVLGQQFQGSAAKPTVPPLVPTSAAH
jgi:hypothetical protein